MCPNTAIYAGMNSEADAAGGHTADIAAVCHGPLFHCILRGGLARGLALAFGLLTSGFFFIHIFKKEYVSCVCVCVCLLLGGLEREKK